MPPKTHYAIKWNTHLTHHTGTLCGKESFQSEELNGDINKASVTCKLCLKILDNPKRQTVF